MKDVHTSAFKKTKEVVLSIKSRLLQPVIHTWQLLRWAGAESWQPSEHRGPGRKKSTMERITESYFNGMENRDQSAGGEKSLRLQSQIMMVSSVPEEKAE